MNYFKIGGKAYRAEVRQAKVNPGEPPFYSFIDVLWSGHRWLQEKLTLHETRPAARRSLARAIERLATGPGGKRANFEVVYPLREFEAWTRRVASASGELAESLWATSESFEHLGDSFRATARKIIGKAAEKRGVRVEEFARRVRGEVGP